MPELPFWESKSLEEMNESEWESLCDGCGRCCLQKLEDSDSGSVHFTSIACRLLDCETCRCSNYAQRQIEVPDCTMVRPITAEKLTWLPDTCAYKRLANGLTLPEWHPLVSADAASVHDAGVSVKFWAIPEGEVEVADYQDYLIDFDSTDAEPQSFTQD